MFTVGTTYETRGGWIATLVYRLECGPQPLVVVHHREDEESVEQHDGRGRYSASGSETQWDLVRVADPRDWEFPAGVQELRALFARPVFLDPIDVQSRMMEGCG